MAYMALYRKWRPMTFDEVVEQEAVVTVLRNAVITGRIAHAYLFCGTRGTGKTTMAKIFARAVNCLNPQNGSPCNECDICKGILNQQILDVSEIDAASNNGVDNVRSIIEETAYSSSVAKYKVFIIDEVHMLSSGAFNALLKTLEEPPEGVIFILATTEPNKLPVTILSRCQRYDFKRISQNGIIGRLEHICSEQNIDYEMPALAFLAQKSDGALRDAISLLDQTLASCGGKLTLRAARASTGAVDKEFIENFAINIIESNGAEILKQISVLFSEGRDPSDFIAELMQIYRNALVITAVKNSEGLLYETEESMTLLKKLAAESDAQELSLMIRELSKLDNNLKWAVQRKILFEAGILSLCDRKWDASDASVSERISVLENRISDMAFKFSEYFSNYKPAAAQNKINQREITEHDSNKNSAKQTADKISYDSQPQPNDKTKTANADSTKVNQAEQSSGTESTIASPAVSSSSSSAASHSAAADAAAAPTASTAAAAVSARPADGTDWDEFIMNVSSKGQPSLSSLIKINAKGVLDGRGNLILVFANQIVKDMIIKKDASDLLSESASAAYGIALRIMYSTKKELNEILQNAEPAPAVQPKSAPTVQPKSAPTVQPKSAPTAQPKSVPPTQSQPTPSPQPQSGAGHSASEQADTFQNAVRILKELSEKEGFTVDDTVDDAVEDTAEDK